MEFKRIKSQILEKYGSKKLQTEPKSGSNTKLKIETNSSENLKTK